MVTITMKMMQKQYANLYVKNVAENSEDGRNVVQALQKALPQIPSDSMQRGSVRSYIKLENGCKKPICKPIRKKCCRKFEDGRNVVQGTAKQCPVYAQYRARVAKNGDDNNEKWMQKTNMQI